MKEAEINKLLSSELRVLDGLEKAGFSPREIYDAVASVNFEDLSAMGRHADALFLKEDFLTFVEGALDPSRFANERRTFLKSYMSSYLTRDGLVTRSTERLMEKIIFEPKLENDFRIFFPTVFMSGSGGSSRQKQILLLGSEVMQSDYLYQLFDNSVGSLINFSMTNREVYNAIDLGEVAFYVANSPYGHILVEGRNEQILNKLTEMNGLISVINNEDLANIFSDFFDTDETWVDKVQFSEMVIAGLGAPIVKKKDLEHAVIKRHIDSVSKGSKWSKRDLEKTADSLSPEAREGLAVWRVHEEKKDQDINRYLLNLAQDIKGKEVFISKEKLERMRRRENPWHPLVSLGIARTVGYEVEYPVPRDPHLARLEAVITSLGIKRGGGGSSYTETSPGPFYDPETANFIFGLFADTGLVNFFDGDQMTMHFNAGVEIHGVSSLVRAMHLTGAGIEPRRGFDKDVLKIMPNSQDGGRTQYTECKAFDVTTRGDFEWNMKSASYLSWALGAQQDVSKRKGEGETAIWKGRLASVWQSYICSMKKGLTSMHLKSYLKNPINNSYSVNEAMHQLRFIYAHPQARFGKLSEIDMGFDERILPVAFDGKYWPNVAIFARETTNIAVAKIEKIADRIEAQAIADLDYVEKAKGRKKIEAMSSFLEKYGYQKVMQNQGVGKVFVYTEVKKALIQAE